MGIHAGFIGEIEWADESSEVVAALEIEEGEMASYIDLEERVQELIDDGTFSPGEKSAEALQWLASVKEIWKRRGWSPDSARAVTLSD